MKRSWLVIVLGMGVLAALKGQPNPFEQRYRLSAEDRQRIAFSSRNPFELIRGEEAAVLKEYLPSGTRARRYEPQEDRRYVKAPGIQFWVYLGLFIMLTILIGISRSLLGQMARGAFNDQLSVSLQRNRDRVRSSPYFLWSLFFFFNAGIFGVQAANWFTGSSFPGQKPVFLLWFSAGIAGFYLLKYIILRVLGGIFPLEKPCGQYAFAITLFNALLGLGLFPVNVAVSYTSGGARELFLFIGFGLIAISYLLRIARGLWIGLPWLMRHPIHFFLYLCAVEMAPLVVLVRELGLG